MSDDIVRRLAAGDMSALGLPSLPAASPEVSEEDMRKLAAGDFSSLGLPQPLSYPTAEECQQDVRERSTDVLSQWSKLRQIVERHETIIRKRWMKKTKGQRASIILAAWSGMAAKHRPDYEAFFRDGSGSRDTRFKEAYMWPYMNVEDLVKGKTFLLLLNSRGRHAPHVFAQSDFEATSLGRISGALPLAFLNMHTLLLDGETVETYGRLVPWGDDQEAMMKSFNGLGYLPGSGLMILEIQQKILKFLVQCSHRVLHDINPNDLISRNPVEPEPPSLADSPDWSSLVAVAAEAPYRLPTHLELDRLKALVEARLHSAEDCIRDLREDPGYFASVLGDWSEHRQEKLVDTIGARHPLLDTPKFWQTVIGTTLEDAYGNLVVWDIIGKQLTDLAALQINYRSAINPEKELPKEYMKALLTFRHTLKAAAQQGPINLLRSGAPASPPLRSFWVRQPQDPNNTMVYVEGRPGAKSDKLLWLFNKLWEDPKKGLLAMPNIVDEIEYIISNDPTQKSRISSWVASVFSNLGIMAQLQRQVEIYFPWAAGYEYARAEHQAEIEKEYTRQFRPYEDLVRNLKASAGPFAKLGAPSGSRFNYPSEKRRTKQSTETMRQAELNLDRFWIVVDENFRKTSGKTLNETFEHIYTNKRKIERTPEWVEPIKEKKQTPSQKAKPDDDLSFISRYDSTSTSVKFIIPQPKNKAKTRGTAGDANQPSLPNEVAPLPATPLDTQPIFKLKPRACKVFKNLFYTPSQSDAPGEIAWADFLYAMANTGFGVQKLYGSVWQFTPSTLDVERSIQFHEPHPLGKIPFRMARTIGRRLNRAYGWHGGMFVNEGT